MLLFFNIYKFFHNSSSRDIPTDSLVYYYRLREKKKVNSSSNDESCLYFVFGKIYVCGILMKKKKINSNDGRS